MDLYSVYHLPGIDFERKVDQMKNWKKLSAFILAGSMMLSLAACGGGSAAQSPAPSDSAPSESTAPESETPTGKIALVTDVGTIDDESFNQACWQGVEAYGKANNIEYQYYQPAADSTDDRMASIRQAVSEGASVIVMPGYLFGEAVVQAQEQFPDVKFIAIDVGEGDLGGATLADNAYCAVFGEEQCGFLAGYGAVEDGYTSLGFLGGIAVPAVVRYGYGYIQGINAAAEEMGTDVTVNYTYGGQFFGDANITAKMEGWYQSGTQVVFACGGGIWTSAVEAALKNNGQVIGVDVDQHYLGENADYAYNPFITSAMKGLQAATESALDKYFSGNWADLGGKIETLNLQAGDSYVGLPTDDASWGFKTFSKDQYEAEKAKIADGTVTVSNDIDNVPTVGSHVTLNIIE